MFLSDQKIIDTIDHLKSSGKIKFKTHAYEVMGVDTVRVHKILKPEKHKQSFHFSAENIRLFCSHYGINANYIYGIETNMYLKQRISEVTER